MRILLTNDDGIGSPNLRRLAEFLLSQPQITELTVVAPDRERSGVGHAFTYSQPLQVSQREDWPCSAYSISGTPADCVKFAIDQLFPFKPDLVLSGPNLGHNAGVAVFYSGTLAGAREGALWNCPSVALSLHYQDPLAMDLLEQWLQIQLDCHRFQDLQAGLVWNVNFPHTSIAQGPHHTQVCTMSETMYADSYSLQANSHPPLWQLKGDKPKELFVDGTDDWHLERGNITLVPLQITQTHLSELQRLQALWSIDPKDAQ